MSGGNGETKLMIRKGSGVGMSQVFPDPAVGRLERQQARDTRLTPEQAEDEPEVRLLRLEVGMGQAIYFMGAVARRFKAQDIKIRGLEDAIRQMVKVNKRF